MYFQRKYTGELPAKTVIPRRRIMTSRAVKQRQLLVQKDLLNLFFLLRYGLILQPWLVWNSLCKPRTPVVTCLCLPSAGVIVINGCHNTKLHLFTYVFMGGVHMPGHTYVHMEIRGQLVALSFNHVGSWDKIQVVSPGCRHLYPLGRCAGPLNFFVTRNIFLLSNATIFKKIIFIYM